MDLQLVLSHPAWGAATGALMVGATALLVIVTRQLVVATRQLVRTSERQAAFYERQEEVKLRMTYAGVTPDDKAHFDGFTLANVGGKSVTIAGACISEGIPATDTNTASSQMILGWVKEYNGRPVSKFEPPHRLVDGDSIGVLYDVAALKSRLDPGQRIRHECWDVSGNHYVTKWIDYHKGPKTISYHDSPGEGFREPTMPENPIVL